MKVMKKLIPIFDAGHGGLHLGKYECLAGGRKVTYPFGTIYEGEFNRAIVSRLVEMCSLEDIPFATTNLNATDDRISERVDYINGIVRNNPDLSLYCLSIHSNATQNPDGLDAHGSEVFVYTYASNTSRVLATALGEEYIKHYGASDWRFGNKIKPKNGLLFGGSSVAIKRSYEVFKEANFGMLRMTRCPAILLENNFMDNQNEAKDILLNRAAREHRAGVIMNFVRKAYYGTRG